MRILKALAVALLAATVHGSPLQAQRGGSAPAAPALTALDHIEIRQLVARYASAVDGGADSGKVYAALFAPDGVFVDSGGRETRGGDALAELARRFTRGPQSAFHFVVNHVIEPAADGATGKEYLVQLRIGEGDRPNDVVAGGRYDDVYVRTSEGWRFKRRQYFPSEGNPRTRIP